MRTIAALTAAIVMIPAIPAKGHPAHEIDQMRHEWADDAFRDGWLTMDEAATYLKIVALENPPVVVRRKQASPTAPPASVAPRAVSPLAAGWDGTLTYWEPLLATYFAPADMPWARRVMACESRGNPLAKNPYSSASGLFQHLARFWPARSANAGWGGADIFDPEANVAVAAWLFYTGGPGHWVCK